MACCCGGGACCECSASFPLSTALAFSNVSVTQTVVRVPGLAQGQESTIKSFLEGISPSLAQTGGTCSSIYQTQGCPVVNFRDTCQSCPPDFYASHGCFGAPGNVVPTLRANLSCGGLFSSLAWCNQNNVHWQLEKPSFSVIPHPCGPNRYIFTFSNISTQLQSPCGGIVAGASISNSITVRAVDYRDFSEVIYDGTALIALSFTYPNPLP